MYILRNQITRITGQLECKMLIAQITHTLGNVNAPGVLCSKVHLSVPYFPNNHFPFCVPAGLCFSVFVLPQRNVHNWLYIFLLQNNYSTIHPESDCPLHENRPVDLERRERN